MLEELSAAQARGATIYGEVRCRRHQLRGRTATCWPGAIGRLQNVLEAVLQRRRGQRRRDWPHSRPRPEHADLRRGRIAGDQAVCGARAKPCRWWPRRAISAISAPAAGWWN